MPSGRPCCGICHTRRTARRKAVRRPRRTRVPRTPGSPMPLRGANGEINTKFQTHCSTVCVRIHIFTTQTTTLIMKKIALALAALLPLGAAAQVSQYAPGMSLEEGGITYFLPKTYIEVRFDLEREAYEPGEFAQYAKSELGITNKGERPSERWRITRCTVDAAGVPDKDKAFFIKYKPKYTAPLVTLTDDGIIRGINVELPDTEEEAFTPTVRSDKAGRIEAYMTEEMLMASSTARKAKLVAREIFEIRESRNLLLRGEAETMPGDNESLKLIMEKLDEQEKALLAPFVGTTTVTTKQVVLHVNPTAGQDGAVIRRFSERFGLVDADDLSGDPIYIKVKDLETVPVDTLLGNTVNNKNDKAGGVVYNVPGKAEVSVTLDGEPLAEATLPVTQFGGTEVLGDVLFNKNSTIRIEFDPVSGAIVHIER